MYTYLARVTKVYDGDTLTCDIDLGFNMWMRAQKIRLADIDAPELVGPCRPPDDTDSIRLIRAEYRKVDFVERYEYQAVLATVQRATEGLEEPGSPSRIQTVLLHGVGGAGKTRLAGEVVEALKAQGWYAGFYAKESIVA